MRNASENAKELRRSIVMGILLGVTLAAAFLAGFLVRDYVQAELPTVFAAQVPADSEGYPLVDEVQALLDNHYLRPLPEYAQRQYAAIRGLLGALNDRNTFFIEPPVAQSESDVLAGTYGGIGVTLQRSSNNDFVLYPFPDGPAANAGILTGDILRVVNGQVLDGSEQQDAVDQLLRGEVKENNGVEITVERDGVGEAITVFIQFDVINVPSVLWRVLSQDERIGYVQLLRFTNRTPAELDEALADLTTQGIQALVLDVRNNGGGLLQESIQVAGRFLDGGVVLYEQTRAGERVYEAERETVPRVIADIPLVVLVNGGTASAAELVAGAIQDRERGTLLGQVTYGKGTIQQIFTLSDRSSIHVTSAEWFTPNRSALDGVGLVPDIAMIPDASGRDIEIDEAIRFLQRELES